MAVLEVNPGIHTCSAYCNQPSSQCARCRRTNLWAPWCCKHEEHKYELCQYAGYKRRLLKQSYLKHHETHGTH